MVHSNGSQTQRYKATALYFSGFFLAYDNINEVMLLYIYVAFIFPKASLKLICKRTQSVVPTIIVLKLTSENEFSGSICICLAEGKIFSKFVVKCAATVLKIGWEIKNLWPKYIWIGKWQAGEVTIFPENFKILNILSKKHQMF